MSVKQGLHRLGAEGAARHGRQCKARGRMTTGHFRGRILAAWGCIWSPNLAKYPFLGGWGEADRSPQRTLRTRHFWAP